ncbi:hypothetical protein ATZ33_05960 [Enterococcus silesiacus]|uniref:Uncharacterized protein n=1 Tax=Enterococcus silesiacus TaxID=332949 RepID=A0A0S3K9D5_9ENTE|nr:hypothetical protein [Enterococcus silesiacus]ALS00928.1 hypothetical protein ATZ33_05960 [Enterococcus silesiacus]OJG89925.1 hypothetical protein RV15_GL001491 [Enterococcus silesiacus]
MIVTLLLFLALLIPSAALAVRRYRDAGLRGRGFLVFWIIATASSYTNLNQGVQSISMLSNLDNQVYTQQAQSGSVLIAFLGYAIGLLFFVLTLLPTDFLTTTSRNKFVCFFLREKENDDPFSNYS